MPQQRATVADRQSRNAILDVHGGSYGYTLFMNCELGAHILPQGWHNWGNKENEKTSRYLEYNNRGEGAKTEGRVAWAKQLTKKEAAKITPAEVFGGDTGWLR